jgi:hypothetical protein
MIERALIAGVLFILAGASQDTPIRGRYLLLELP